MTIFIWGQYLRYTCTTFKLEGGDELAIQEYPQLVKVVFSNCRYQFESHVINFS